MRRFTRNSFSAVAAAYAKDVLSEKTPACVQIKQAAQRFQADFDRRDLIFSEDAVDHVCNFIQGLVHVKGKWAGQPIRLEPFQVFALANIFGWLERTTGLRRYRQALILLPRKNGKSLLAAGIALYMVFADGEQGAEGYSGATSLEQANEVFEPARRMVEMSPGLAEALDISVAKSAIYSVTTGSKFSRVIANTKDGSSPHFACCDELHQARDDTQINAFRTGMGARSQPLLLIITTAGNNLAGVCHAEQMEAEAVLAGLKANDRLFALIYTIDPGDDWRDEASWRKANPNWGVSIGAAYLQDQLSEARQSPAKQAAIRTKHLNQWVASAAGWLTTQLWASAIDETLDIARYHGREAYLAADISTRQDLTAVSLIIPETGRKLIFPFAHLPEGALDASPNAPAYRDWIDSGHLSATEGTASDFEEVRRHVLQLCRDFKIVKAIFDPWQGEFLRQEVEALGIETEIWPASAPALWTTTLDDFEADLKNGHIRHPNNPVLNWCAANVAIYEKGVTRIPVKPSKSQKHQKIDVMIATLMAYAASCETPPTPPIKLTFAVLD